MIALRLLSLFFLAGALAAPAADHNARRCPPGKRRCCAGLPCLPERLCDLVRCANPTPTPTRGPCKPCNAPPGGFCPAICIPWDDPPIQTVEPSPPAYSCLSCPPGRYCPQVCYPWDPERSTWANAPTPQPTPQPTRPACKPCPPGLICPAVCIQWDPERNTWADAPTDIPTPKPTRGPCKPCNAPPGGACPAVCIPWDD